MAQLSSAEQLSYSTVRIENVSHDGSLSSGTGFFFNFPFKNDDEQYIPVIITNKHVVKNAMLLKILFTSSDDDGNAIDTEHHTHILRLDHQQSGIRFHPDKDVDLCAIPIAEVLTSLDKENKKAFYVGLHERTLPTKEQLEDLDAIEELLMIGYPNGIWDSYNNKPLFRRGITATHPKLDYNGKKEIMIDMACFPGSSGSPVFIYNNGSYKTKTKALMSGTRALFLGVLYAGPQHTATGKIEIANIPTRQEPVSISRIPNNLGLIIKSERILELGELF